MIINHKECASTADGSHANDTHFVARNAAKERKLFSKPLPKIQLYDVIITSQRKLRTTNLSDKLMTSIVSLTNELNIPFAKSLRKCC